MIVNTKIKEVLKEVADKSILYGNDPDVNRKYLRRMLTVFNKQLTEDEQLYIFKLMLEQVYYKNILTDPENINNLNNIKLKTYGYIFLLAISFMAITGMVFKANASLSGISDTLLNIMTILTL